jgi:hypothetical protein
MIMFILFLLSYATPMIMGREDFSGSLFVCPSTT